MARLLLMLLFTCMATAAMAGPGVSVEASHESVSAVCADLQRQSGVDIQVHGGDVPVTLSLSGISLEQALAVIADVAGLQLTKAGESWLLCPLDELLDAVATALAAHDVSGARERWLQLPAGLLRLAKLSPARAPMVLSLAEAMAATGQADDASKLWNQMGSIQERLEALFSGSGSRREILHNMRRAAQLCETLGDPDGTTAANQCLQTLLGARRLTPVLAAVDARATADPQWKQKIQNRIRYCSRVLDARFGIALQIVGIVEWQPPKVDLAGGPDKFAQLLGDLSSHFPLGMERAELVLGFVSVPLPADRAQLPEMMVYGLAPPQYRGYVVVRDVSLYARDLMEDNGTLYQVNKEWTLSPEMVRQTLLHEIAHALGALHTDDPKSVMRSGTGSTPTEEFDAKNAALLTAAKWMEISKGPQSLDEPELLALIRGYQGLEGAAAAGNGAELCETEALQALGELYAERGATAQATAAYQSVIDLCARLAGKLKIVDASGNDLLAAAGAKAGESLLKLNATG